MDLHGLTGTMMTYDDCLDTVEPVNATNVVKQDNDYVYKWTTGGVASYASSTTETVSNPTWEKKGYVCRPSKVESKYGSTMNFAECEKNVQAPDASKSVTAYTTQSGPPNDVVCVKYAPFAHLPDKWWSPTGCKDATGPGGALEGGFGEVFDCTEPLGDEKNTKFATEIAKCLKLEPICDYFKQDSLGPFTCTKTSSNDALPTTHNEAVTYYKKNYAADALCAPLKKNAPFQCTGSEPKSAVEILSLSFSNTELAFSVFGTLFVLILYKCKKAKDPDFLQEDELLDELAKLKADNAAIKKAMEEDNAAMKKAMEEENAAMKKAMEEENAAMKSAMEATNEAIKRLEAGKA